MKSRTTAVLEITTLAIFIIIATSNPKKKENNHLQIDTVTHTQPATKPAD